MAEGPPNQAICERLRAESETVEAYVRAVFTKLGLTKVPTTTAAFCRLAFMRG